MYCIIKREELYMYSKNICKINMNNLFLNSNLKYKLYLKY